jgi:DNA-directed RNA polymerase specialized sigma24 family protein
MDPHPDDLTATDDLTLLHSARAGDRLAFGVLYLRHHAAAWRMACVACRFSPDAELAVIEGFTRVFSALPAESEEFDAAGVTFRPYLLACVRQAALDRASAAGRAERAGAGQDEPAPLAGLAPDGEVVLSSLEHHVARGALAALPEQSRTALWLSDVEAMTPGEIAGILGGSAAEITDLAAAARAGVQASRTAAFDGHEVRADCRFTVEHLDEYEAGKLEPAEGVLVRSHLDTCLPCRMRLDELTNAPAALAAAVPAAPLLGGEAQHHWLTATDIRPAERLLPPGVAAAGPVRRLPDVLRRVHRSGRPDRGAPRGGRPQPASIDLTVSADAGAAPGWTGSPGWSGTPVPSRPPAWTIPPGRTLAPPPPQRRRRDRRAALSVGVPAVVRRVRGAVPRVFGPVALVVAWLAVMLALPYLMQPATAPGPSGMALPAVQAYLPDYLPGARRAKPVPAPKAPAPVAAEPAAGIGSLTPGGSELSVSFVGTAAGRAGGTSAGRHHTVKVTPAVVAPGPRPAVAPPAAPAVTPAVTPAVEPVAVPPAPTKERKPKKDKKEKHSTGEPPDRGNLIVSA